MILEMVYSTKGRFCTTGESWFWGPTTYSRKCEQFINKTESENTWVGRGSVRRYFSFIFGKFIFKLSRSRLWGNISWHNNYWIRAPHKGSNKTREVLITFSLWQLQSKDWEFLDHSIGKCVIWKLRFFFQFKYNSPRENVKLNILRKVINKIIFFFIIGASHLNL